MGQGAHILINIPNFVENDLVMIVSGKFIRFWWRLSLLLAIASLYGRVVACTRDLPDPWSSQPQQPSQPQTPSEPQQPVHTDPQPQTPPEPQQPEGQVDIPDSTFRAWILWNYDSNKDGVLDQGEAASVTKIEFSTENVTTLDGIQYFPNLTYLHAQGIRDWDNDKNLGKLTELDLSGNPKLQHIHLIYNNIKTLKLAECPDLDYLCIDYNEVTELDVKGFHHMTLLQVSYNQLKTIDVSGLDILDEFHCADNPLETITLSNPKLVSFRCAGTLIKELDLSKCPKINNLDCSNCPNLTTIKIAKGQVIGNITKDDKAKFEYYE